MNFRVRVTDSALGDVAAIFEWIQTQGAPRSAEDWYWDVMDAVDSLSAFPERCPIALENDQFREAEIRQRLIGEYRILFTIRGRTVSIVHVRNAARQPASREELRRGLVESEE